MDNSNLELMPPLADNVIPMQTVPIVMVAETPVTDSLEMDSQYLNKLSLYQSGFDWDAFRDLERRAKKLGLKNGFVFKSPFRYAGSHSTCQQCLYTFEIDTYGRGCAHNCVYCYAKAQLTVHGMWNNPFPVPMNPADVHKIFYTAFETDKPSKWRKIMLKRVPLRIGSMSDSFMWMDEKYKVTQELLKILKFYNYPFVAFTRSDLIAKDQYLNLMDPKNASIQFSISSTNDAMNRKIEPGAPSAARRLKALRKISEAGFWTTVRINPVFPIHPDGYFTDPNFQQSPSTPKFDYFSFDMVDELSQAGVKSVLAGFGRFSSYSLNRLFEATGTDLKGFYRDDVRKSKRDFHFSDKEVRYYYEKIAAECKRTGVEFSTCYIGNGEEHFWNDQDLWDNKSDCCNIQGRVEGFQTSSRSVKFETRLKYSSDKSVTPVRLETLHLGLNNMGQMQEADLI